MEWKTFDGKKIHLDVRELVEQTILREKALGFNLKVCIGTDSRVHGSVSEFATVIVFLREGKGGFMFIHLSKEAIKMSLKQRMLAEVAKSVEVAYAICDLLESHKIPLEVHADINTDPHFKSNIALREAMGYILSMGFIFKCKPNAFASSYCADYVI
ncbi:MAG: hypothetical protein IPM48_12770 [Saprospiraceae bacterium]|nr:hypothetical protein [Saprospiraceae bacterium]